MVVYFLSLDTIVHNVGRDIILVDSGSFHRKEEADDRVQDEASNKAYDYRSDSRNQTQTGPSNLPTKKVI